MPQLCVNIDHVATLRQARYRHDKDYGEPDVARAAHEAELGGADGITVHLREDRRHMIDADVARLREFVRVKFNLEMAATSEMVAIAKKIKPHTAMLVPEGRMEVTTEGGLNVVKHKKTLTTVVKRLKDAGCVVSAFIDADLRQVEAAHDAGFDVCEVHTGPYARAFRAAGGDLLNEALLVELESVAITGGEIGAAGMRFNAGHALNHANVTPIAALPGVAELHIGHAIVSRAVFVGLRESVREMKALLQHAEDAHLMDLGGEHA
ncbi:MAG: pyridoxine 5'-phosphate synthase [Phycisphaerales bacterium]|nr:MAG: pyridoxine 5'-phosphate synthase [Phycisphaerales bacterium]